MQQQILKVYIENKEMSIFLSYIYKYTMNSKVWIFNTFDRKPFAKYQLQKNGQGKG